MNPRAFFPLLALLLLHCSEEPTPASGAGAAGEGGSANAGEAGSSGGGGAGTGGLGGAGGSPAGAGGKVEAGAGGDGGGAGSGLSGSSGDGGSAGQAGGGGEAGSSGSSGQAGGGGQAGSGGAPGCSPYDDTAPCEAGFTCLSESHDGSVGVCKKVGTKALGSSCPTQLVHTGCVEGLVCAEEPHGNHAHPTCRQICDPLAVDPGCPSNRLCTAGYLLGGLTGACIAEHEDEQNVGLGEPCGSKVKSGIPCAPEAGKRYQGACVQESGGMVCRRLCALAGDGCGAEGVCQDTLGLGTLGVCQP